MIQGSLARTETEIFRAFLEGGHEADGLRWREYWRQYYMDQLQFYWQNKWYVIPCGKFSKRPLAGWPWSKKALTYQQAIWYAAAGYNLAVCAKPSNLVILDCDSPEVADLDLHTLTMITSKGGAFFTKGPYDPSADRALRRAGIVTEGNPVRAGVMFQLVPLSRTCTFDRGGRCEHPMGVGQCDYRIREWVDTEVPIAPFSEVVRRLT